MEDYNIYDVVIIGAGPAGMTAAIYMSRAGFSTIMIDRGVPGGQMTNTEEIENYPGYKKILGSELAEKMFEHAKSFGADFVYGDVREIVDGKEFKIIDTGNKKYRAKAVIVSTGAKPSTLGVKGESEFAGRGVSYCAVCDGAFFRDLDVAVIGGGDAAIEEAIFLAKIASKVTIIHRRDELRATKILQDRARKNEKITFALSSIVIEILGEQNVNGLRIKNIKNGEESIIPAAGIFIYVGTEPITSIVKNLGVTDENGYIITDQNLETAVSGIFAAGDVRNKTLRQIVTAASDGSIVAIAVQQYLEGLEE